MNRVSLTVPCFALLAVGLLNPPRISFQIQEPAPHQTDEQLQMFSGTVVSTDNILFLRGDDHKTMYGLDDQNLAMKFLNKKVSVTGTLDRKATIHVKNIEEQKA
jgi:hypothetical protein